MIYRINKCRVCDGKLTNIIFTLGDIYPSTFIRNSASYESLTKAPLNLVRCTKCNTTQLAHTLPLDAMYKKYWYRSGLNRSMVADLQDVAMGVLSKLVVNKGDLWIDIGCNDCTLFKFVPNSMITLGFDPALNLNNNDSKCTIFINDYFKKEYLSSQKAKVITSIAMFYDVPNVIEFCEIVRDALDEKGIWVIQFTDLLSMMKVNAFDNICHEHLFYYTLENLDYIMKEVNLNILDVEYNFVNGGSIRVYVGHKENKDTNEEKVAKAISEEKDFFNSEAGTFANFNYRIFIERDRLVDYLRDSKSKGKRIHLLGASTKGNTLLQVYRIDNELVDFAAEVNEDKFGLYTVGSNIPIISEDLSLKLKPDIYLVLPWHFKDMLLEKFSDFIKNGGELIFPLPYFSNGERIL